MKAYAWIETDEGYTPLCKRQKVEAFTINSVEERGELCLATRALYYSNDGDSDCARSDTYIYLRENEVRQLRDGLSQWLDTRRIDNEQR